MNPSSSVDFNRKDVEILVPIPKYHQLALQYEAEIFTTFTGFTLNKDGFIFDVPIDFYGKNYIHTIRCGDQNKVDLVLLHGYGGSGVTYYKMFKGLAKHYRVFAIDMLGLGLSSKPAFDLNNTDDCISFFVESTEKWRQKIGLKKFHLVGHSMGGYISGFYASKYPQYVLKLSLLSPAGINKDCIELDFERYLDSLNFWRRLYMEYMWNWWKKRTTPGMIFKDLGLIGRMFFHRYAENRFKMLPKEEVKLLSDYMVNVLMEPESSEKAIHLIYLPPRAAAFRPLQDHLISLNIPVDLYFGTRDWIDSSEPQKISHITKGRVKSIFIPYAGHQLIVENPRDTVDHIILFSEEYINRDSVIKSNKDKDNDDQIYA